MPIAIDFGTSNTVITRWNPVTQQPETLSLPGLSTRQGLNPPLIPSLVYIEAANQDKVLIGQQIRDRGLDLMGDSRFFRSFKRGVGADIQGFLPEIDGETITFEKVGTWFLQGIIGELLSIEGGLDSLVLTVPVDSFEVYRYWLGKVFQALPVTQIRMLDEPTAAALAYGVKEAENLLVIDFGGGTLDLSLVKLDKKDPVDNKPVGFLLKWGNKSLAQDSLQKVKTAKVLAKSGQNLGGTDIDNWIVDYFVTTQGLPVNSITTRLAERLKIELSTHNQAGEVYFDDQNFASYELELNRQTLETILQDRGFFAKLDETMLNLLQQARHQGVQIDDISAVLLVGGTVQLPAIQKWIQQYFPLEKIRCQKPFEAIAQGALQITQGLEIKDFLYHSYGIRYWDRRNQRHSWQPIIKAGQSYPMTQPVELVLGASRENQPSIELIIGELAETTGGTEVYFDGDRLITRQVNSSTTLVKPLNDSDRKIAQLTPLGFPGSDRIKVKFQVDEERFLKITVEDLLTNNTLLENQIVAQLS
ncbi:Hsp70 family protein [Cylindrospermopsis raciborskii]|jgi:molecular chaperone DnaK (HSP70)|uniref:Hsp70 family protein n=1 Tax=Cylindrospermopsis raciborskii TaxID=77022 RepID=UPI000E1E8F36|nr:Hsp70 family protein [Cylindrospermopsis raciborskii]TPX29275.1 Hsp70 family protein [Cylindrospermopsis raciborskii GIHE 2018]UJS04873.1 Hsp70 family protein [Cylindrospermopsis raciborskii KLL07]